MYWCFSYCNSIISNSNTEAPDFPGRTGRGTGHAPSFSMPYYSRSTAEDAFVESKSSGETSVDIATTKTKHSESSYRIFTSKRTGGRGGLNGLTTVANPSQYDSNRESIRSMSLRQRGFNDTRTTVHARVISRTCFERHSPLLLSRLRALSDTRHQLLGLLDAPDAHRWM